jgi:hypothetical protein
VRVLTRISHDIIDNRKQKSVDRINRILSSTEAARFAVGYFFLSGLESVASRLAAVKELRLLIGNLLRRNGLNGQALLKALAKLYDQRNLRDWVDRRSLHARRASGTENRLQ